MRRDIDYAAVAVKTAIVEKFGRREELDSLEVTAGERTIVVQHNEDTIEGTRDDLLARVRKAEELSHLWNGPARSLAE